MTFRTVSEAKSFGGTQGVYAHDSGVTGTGMTFAVFVPEHVPGTKLPVLWYLSGLTCTHANVMEKGEYRVSLDTLFRILGEFNMSVSEFFEDPAPVAVTGRELQLAREIGRLEPAARREVEAFVAFKRSQQLPELERAKNDD